MRSFFARNMIFCKNEFLKNILTKVVVDYSFAGARVGKEEPEQN